MAERILKSMSLADLRSLSGNALLSRRRKLKSEHDSFRSERLREYSEEYAENPRMDALTTPADYYAKSFGKTVGNRKDLLTELDIKRGIRSIDQLDAPEQDHVLDQTLLQIEQDRRSKLTPSQRRKENLDRRKMSGKESA